MTLPVRPTMTPTVHPLKLCFKGSRTYLHGTDVYEEIAALARRELRSDDCRLQFAIRRFFSAQPDLHWTPAPGAPGRPADAVVDFSVSTPAPGVSGWMSESSRKVDCRVDYDEDLVVARCSYGEDSIAILGETGYRPIEVAVSMTKALHNRQMPAVSGRWIFTKLEMGRLFRPGDARNLSILLRQNLHGRLTKSDIRAGGESIGSIYFSLVPQ